MIWESNPYGKPVPFYHYDDFTVGVRYHAHYQPLVTLRLSSDPCRFYFVNDRLFDLRFLSISISTRPTSIFYGNSQAIANKHLLELLYSTLYYRLVKRETLKKSFLMQSIWW